MAAAMVMAMATPTAMAAVSKDNINNGKDDDSGGGSIPAQQTTIN
jgi:hypothetical protein